MGEKAFDMGLVDEIGNFHDAVQAAANLGRIEGKPRIVHFEKKKSSLLDFLLGVNVSRKLDTMLNGSYNFLRYQLPAYP